MRLDYIPASRRARTCKGCGKLFQPTNGHTDQVFCTNACFHKTRWNGHETKQALTCPHCGRGFLVGAGRKQKIGRASCRERV